ncbi:protein takeout-like [Euwallacea similis]|uniref:protein takeout-like n=1 Tax=Euwallacea similis TaxID=1736056 RepID=UPI00344E02EE
MILIEVFVLLAGTCASSVWSYTVQDAPLLTHRPQWLKPCKKSNPNIGACVNDMFLFMFPNLAAGIPEINVEHFEPLLLENVSISKGNGPIILTGKLYDLVVMGPSNSTPTDSEFIQSANKQGQWNFGLNIPLLDIKSKYNLKGQILVLPLLGHGNCDLKLFNIRTRIYANLTFVEKEEQEIMYIENLKVKFRVGGLRVQFENLFNGNKILGHTVNAFINQNGLEIVGELEESIADSLARIFTKLLNNVFVKIPTDLWLLSDQKYAEYEKEIKTIH